MSDLDRFAGFAMRGAIAQDAAVDAGAAAIGDDNGHTRVWCRECGREEVVETRVALREGWPKCHGMTMSIDPPDKWGN